MTYHDMFLIAGVHVWLNTMTYTFYGYRASTVWNAHNTGSSPHFEWQHYLHHLEENSSYGSITITYFKKKKKNYITEEPLHVNNYLTT